MTTDQLRDLAFEARLYRPRLYAIYGRFRNLDNPDFLGWGMDFQRLGTTLYYEPDTRETHRSDTTDRLLQFYDGIADVRLEYLDLQD